MDGFPTNRPLRLGLRNRQSLLLFGSQRRDCSCQLIVHDGGPFLSIGRDRDLIYILDFAVALVSRFNGVAPQRLQRNSIIRISAFHRVVFAIEFGFPAIACRCGDAQPIADTPPGAGEPGGVFIDAFDPPRTGSGIRARRSLGNSRPLNFHLDGLATVDGILCARSGQHLSILRCGPGRLELCLAGFFAGEVNRIRVDNLHRDRVIRLASDRLVLAVGLYFDFWDATFALVHPIGYRIYEGLLRQLGLRHVGLPSSVERGLCKQRHRDKARNKA
jgi:hypothetical protein